MGEERNRKGIKIYIWERVGERKERKVSFPSFLSFLHFFRSFCPKAFVLLERKGHTTALSLSTPVGLEGVRNEVVLAGRALKKAAVSGGLIAN